MHDYKHICVPMSMSLHMQATRECQIPEGWSYRCLWVPRYYVGGVIQTAVCVIIQQASFLKCLAISPAPFRKHFLNKKKLIYFMCICLYLHCPSAWCQWRSEGDIKFTATGFVNGCEPPCRCWGPNVGSLQEQ